MDKIFLILIVVSGLPISYLSVKELVLTLIRFRVMAIEGFSEEDMYPQCECENCEEVRSEMTAEEITEQKYEDYQGIMKSIRNSIMEHAFFAIFYSGITSLAIYHYFN